MDAPKSPQSLQAIENIVEEIADPLTDEHRCRIWCKVMRLTSQEGMAFMARHGYKIKKDRYNQLMSEINKRVNKRLLYEAQTGFIEQHLASTDLLEHSMAVINNRIIKLEQDDSLRATYALEKMLRIRNETVALLSAYKEKDQYVMERQAATRKLIQQTGAPTSVQAGSLRMTKELALELGIVDYDEDIGGGAPQNLDKAEPSPSV